jgi:hypothetical protein
LGASPSFLMLDSTTAVLPTTSATTVVLTVQSTIAVKLNVCCRGPQRTAGYRRIAADRPDGALASHGLPLLSSTRKSLAYLNKTVRHAACDTQAPRKPPLASSIGGRVAGWRAKMTKMNLHVDRFLDRDRIERSKSDRHPAHTKLIAWPDKGDARLHRRSSLRRPKTIQ